MSLTSHADGVALSNQQPRWWWWRAKRLWVFGTDHNNWNIPTLHFSGHLTPAAGATESRKHTIPTHGALQIKYRHIWFYINMEMMFPVKRDKSSFFDVRLQFGCVLTVWTEKSCIFNRLLFTLLNWFWSYCSLRWVFYSSWWLCCNTLFTFTRLTNKSHQNSKSFIELASNCTIFHFLT